MAGTVVLTSQRSEGVVRWARITATADSADGSFPAVALKNLVNSSGFPAALLIDGTIIGVITNPGAVAPTDNYDITLVDQDGYDRFADQLLNRDTANTEFASVGRPCAPDETLTLTISNNSVNSAVVVITLFWAPSSAVSGSSSLSGSVSITGDVNVTNSGTFAVQPGTSTPGTGATNLGKAIDSAVGATDTVVGVGFERKDTLATLTPADGDYARPRVDSQGAVWTTESGAWSPTTDGVYIGANASGGASWYNSLDLDEGAAEVIKGSAGKLYSLIVTNLHTATIYLKLWNRTSATAGTNNADYCIAVPAGSGIAIDFASGIDFTTGICFGATLGVAASDNTAIPSANLVIASAIYK